MYRQFEKKNKGTTKCDKSTITCDVSIAQCEDGTIKCEKKNKKTIECDKSIVTCDVGIIQCEDGTIKYGKNKGIAKYDKSTVTDVDTHNVRMVPSNMRKKKYENHQK